MPELDYLREPFDEVEELLRGARDFVRPSEDLRPRVLEAARAQRENRWVLRNLGRMAALVFILAFLAGALRQQLDADERPPTILATADELPSPAEPDARDSGAEWNMVDSFTEMRRRQAEAFRPAGDLRRPKA